MATAIINSQMDAINESFSNISSDLTTIRPLLKEKRHAEGRTISITNLDNKNVNVTTTGTAFVVNQDYNLIEYAGLSSVSGINFTSNVKNCVNVSNAATASSTVNRFYRDGVFNGSGSTKTVAFTMTSTKMTLSAAAVIRTIPSGKSFNVYLTNASNSNLTSVTFTATGVKSVVYTGNVGDEIYCKVQHSSPIVGSQLDADIYITLSDGTQPQIKLLAEGANTVYTNNLIVGEQNVAVDFSRGSKLGMVGNTISVTAYNVGKFDHGASTTPAGTAEMYGQFIDTFNETSTDFYLFSEWDANYNSSLTTDGVFGKLRKYWNGRAVSESGNLYIHQKAASAYPISFGELHLYYDGTGRYFLDTIVEALSGANIHLISTHLDFHDPTVRQAEIAKIISYIQDNNIQYAIIGGDFNYGTNSNNPPSTESDLLAIADADIAVWTTAGLSSAQKGQFVADNGYDYINTSNGTSTSLYLKPYDDIVITSTLQFLNTKTSTHNESDHKAIYAVISLI